MFILSLGAPRGWESVARKNRVGRLWAARGSYVAAPASPSAAAPVVVVLSEPVAAAPPQAPLRAEVAPIDPPAARQCSIEPLPAIPADSPARPVQGPEPDPALLASRTTRKSYSAPSELQVDPRFDLDVLTEPTPTPSQPAATASVAAPQTWQEPVALLRMLDRLAADEHAGVWALRASSLVREVVAGRMSTADRAAALAALRDAMADAQRLATHGATVPTASQLHRVRHALERRLAVWDLAMRATAATESIAAVPDPDRLALALTAVERQTAGSVQGKDWRAYLMVDALDQLASGRSLPADKQRELAVRVLERLAAKGLGSDQRAFVSAGPLAALAAELRPWAMEPVRSGDLLASIERYEASGLTSDAARLANAAQVLVASQSTEGLALGRHLENNYRNANLRVALSDELLARFIPSQPVIETTVRDTILGLPVRGRSTIFTRMNVRLEPDPTRLRLALEASGSISAHTGTTSGPATIYANSNSVYTVRQLLALGPQGLEIDEPRATANTEVRLRDVRTDFDNVPFMGMFAQRIARNRQAESTPAARRESERKIAQQAASRIQREAGDKVRAASARFHHEVFDTLVELGLDPQIVEMQTTEHRLVARARLAGIEQLAAHTPRPQAPSDSLASVQIHQSALNNLLEQLDLAGRQMSLAEAYAQIRAKLNRPAKPAPADLRDDVTVRFATNDALNVRCDDGLLRLSLSIAEMKADGHAWRNFTVLVDYRPSLDRAEPALVREGVVRLAGPRLSTKSQVALRGVFSKIFAKDRTISLWPAQLSEDPRLDGLTLTQFVVTDGWLGAALGPQRKLAPAVMASRQPAGN
ncbi:MAG: hypothetical protein K1X74_13750 [Pirellulales bacterium]|nr:hypothetical protein [Pirellulales bacterium]